MTRLTTNVYVQLQGEPLYVACEQQHRNARVRHRFLHIINPYFAAPGSEDDKVQQLTYHTMGMALSLAPAGTVKPVAVTFPEEAVSIPPSFPILKSLQRSVLDLGSFQLPRRFPLLFDIMAGGLAAADGQDYVIFTNVDICLMPHFYGSVQRILNLGFESLIVNRRTIPKYGLDSQLLPLMLADYGTSHPGFDCFVFPLRLFDSFVRSDVCVGAPEVMRALVFNLVALTESLLILRDAHLTFHLGNDKPWSVPERMDYRDHNYQCSQEVLVAHGRDPRRRELLQNFCTAHNEMYTVP
ncbi:MAG: hypothetical protein ACREFM_18255 [Hypericibacter sp.]